MPATTCGLNGSLIDLINKKLCNCLLYVIWENVKNGQINTFESWVLSLVNHQLILWGGKDMNVLYRPFTQLN